MNNIIRIALVAMFLSSSSLLQANEWDTKSVDRGAHLGVSFAIQTFLYGFSKKALDLEKGDALIFSAVATSFIGFTSEMMEMQHGVDGEDLLFNGIGQAAAVGTILVFDF